MLLSDMACLSVPLSSDSAERSSVASTPVASAVDAAFPAATAVALGMDVADTAVAWKATLSCASDFFFLVIDDVEGACPATMDDVGVSTGMDSRVVSVLERSMGVASCLVSAEEGTPT